jgi:polar amino acid transport system substrate-binding protein
MNATKIISGLIFGTLLCAVGLNAASAETALERVKREGVVKMALTNESPFSFKKPDGSLAGIDYDVAGVLFKKLGVNKVEGVATKFGSLIPGLKAGQYDVVGAGLYVRPARCKEVAFSEPNVQVLDAMLVMKGNPANIHSFDDVTKNPALKLGGNQGGASPQNARRAGVPADRVIEFADAGETAFALKAGRIAGLITTSISVNELVAADGGKTVERALPFKAPLFDGKPSINYAAWAFRQEDTDLLAAFNKEWKAFRGSAEHKAILAKYNVTDNEIPAPDVTVADICKE